MPPRAGSTIRGRILEELREHEYRPAELLRKLDTGGVSELEVKEELAALIDSNVLELSQERMLRRR